ncbi:MAG: PDZ domain-containing protein, partial [Mycobacteriaceae bacterium]|nr:PDZ domain-containing protein [Mycobacteriaceae bacterium]
VLFGSRVRPKALAALGGVALLIGLLGALVGTLLGDTTGSLTSKKVTLAQSGSPERVDGAISKVVDAIMPSVVSIQASAGEQADTGSGAVIDGKGYIITNNHVISLVANDTSGQGKILITFSDGHRAPARIVGRDTKTDLAVLKVDNVKNLTVAQLGRSDDVRVGQDVLAVGSPLGLSKTVTSGIVSALHRAVPLKGEGSDTDAVIDAVQTDASINPGNSGGPMVDFRGRIIGINSAIRTESGGSVGLGFAIPVDTMAQIAQGLIRDGRVHHPELGISAKQTTTVTNDVRTGAEVQNVAANSPAARAGIVERDIILKVGDRPVTSASELTVAVQALAIGQSVSIQLIRDGRIVDVPVTLGSD